jgi:hypothetical protein
MYKSLAAVAARCPDGVNLGDFRGLDDTPAPIAVPGAADTTR